MSTIGTMGVRVVLVFGVGATFALVPMAIVLDVRVAVVEVVHVVTMRHRGMPAAWSVGVVVLLVHRMRFRHQEAPIHRVGLALPAM